jgi:hypothetical protein
MKRKLPANLHKQHKPSSTRFQVSRLAPRQDTYLVQTHIHKMEATGNDAHQNIRATWMEVKTLHTQQILYTKQYSKQSGPMELTVRYAVHFKHRNPRMLPI